MTTTVGPAAPSAEKNARHAAWTSTRTWRGSASRMEWSGSSSPTVNASAATARAGSAASSGPIRSRPAARTFSSALAGGSESRTPAWLLRISASGQ